MIWIVLIICFIAYIVLRRSADKTKYESVNRPTVIKDMKHDISSREKYAMVCFLASVQGASTLSAFDDKAQQRAKSFFFSLGLSQQDIERFLNISRSKNGARELFEIVETLDAIRDRQFLKRYMDLCLDIAHLSEDADTIEGIENVYKQMGF